jgi:hypothetical protein
VGVPVNAAFDYNAAAAAEAFQRASQRLCPAPPSSVFGSSGLGRTAACGCGATTFQAWCFPTAPLVRFWRTLAPLCKRLWLEEPNAETIAAIEAARRGEVVTVDTLRSFSGNCT